MNISIIGTGYVGLVSGACLADFGHDVVCVDIDPERIRQLESGVIPFYEPELAEFVARNRARGRLEFTTSLERAVKHGLVIFIAVGTPETASGEADISAVLAAGRGIGQHLDDYRVIATKSTVPIGTASRLAEAISAAASAGAKFDVVSNPEFLREGAAVSDFMRPDRVVIGAPSPAAAALVREIYRPLYLIETPIVVTDVTTAEMIKYAANSFLAVKISFINEVANLCDAVGADVHVVAKAMGLDKRIGAKFLHPGPGFGGSCFPKDTKAFAATARRQSVPLRVVEAAVAANTEQRARILEKIAGALGGEVGGAVIAVLGLSFKPNTSDVRESPAIHICRELLSRGATVRAYDPVAADEALKELRGAGRLHIAADTMDAATGADALVVLTEWNEFRGLDLAVLRGAMRGRAIVDGRNVLDPDAAAAAGFRYSGVGRRGSVARQASIG
jgi:UDPglucose 6-dehydrogenase